MISDLSTIKMPMDLKNLIKNMIVDLLEHCYNSLTETSH